MSKNRIQYTDDFVLKNEKVGINTSDPQETLHVDGNIRTEDAISTDDATLNEFSGFNQETLEITEDVTINDTTRGSYNALSSEVIIDSEVTVSDGSEVSLGRTETLTVTDRLKVPASGSEDREETPEKGSTRFNQDLGQLEFYTGYEWRTVGSYDGSGRGRGIVGDTGTGNRYQYFNIHTLGNTQDFGVFIGNTGGASNGGGSDGIRGVWSGGTGGDGIKIQYNTIASVGNFIEFGDLVDQSDSGGTASSSTRAVVAGAIHRTPLSGITRMDYIEIQTLGNALEFGNLSVSGACQCDGMNSPTRGFFEGGGYPTEDMTINMITIASKGDSTDFGEASVKASYKRNVSSTTRGIACGGRISYPAGLFSDTIDYMTMASTGNAIDFGNLTQARHSPAGAGTLTRGVFCGGYHFSTAPSVVAVNTMDYITIASTGDAIDFGDCSFADSFMSGISDSHGGLGGF